MDNNKHFFDKRKNVNRLLTVLYCICIVLFILDFVIQRHIYHNWENLWGFYPMFGFVSCVVLVFIASWMRTYLKRPEDYYENLEQSKINKNNNVTNGDQDVDD